MKLEDVSLELELIGVLLPRPHDHGGAAIRGHVTLSRVVVVRLDTVDRSGSVIVEFIPRVLRAGGRPRGIQGLMRARRLVM